MSPSAQCCLCVNSTPTGSIEGNTIETIHEDGQRQQLRLLTDGECQAPEADDVAEALLSSLMVRRPRRLGVC